MRIVYSDPISELISLVETSDLSKVSHIALSRDEMRLLVTNARAPALFPEHFGEAERLIARMENEIKRCDR